MPIAFNACPHALHALRIFAKTIINKIKALFNEVWNLFAKKEMKLPERMYHYFKYSKINKKMACGRRSSLKNANIELILEQTLKKLAKKGF